MSALDKKRMLEDILNDYVSSEPNPSHTALEKWIRKFPQYKEELTEFTVNWSLMETLPPSDDIKEVDQDTRVLRAMSIVEDRIHAHAQKKKMAKKKISDLLSEIQKQGLNIPKLAAQTGMGVPMTTKLVQRLIDYTSIPREALKRISGSVGRGTDELIEYFCQPAMIPDTVQLSAKNGPKLSENKESFFDAVRNDRTLDDSQRAFWLSFEKTEE